MCAILSGYVSGGFYVTKRVKRSAWTSKDLLPDRLFSASGCICTFVPDTWCIEWAQKPHTEDTHRAFNLTTDQLHGLTGWVTPRLGESIGWPNVCFSLDVAREMVGSYLGQAEPVVVFELGLHRALVGAFGEAAEPPPPQPGFAPLGRAGVYEAVLKETRLAQGGTPLGFEPLQFDRAPGCSWLCNGLEAVAHDELGIAPNAYGFIDTFEQARVVVDHISRDDVPSEPGLWVPWLVLEHT